MSPVSSPYCEHSEVCWAHNGKDPQYHARNTLEQHSVYREGYLSLQQERGIAWFRSGFYPGTDKNINFPGIQQSTQSFTILPWI